MIVECAKCGHLHEKSHWRLRCKACAATYARQWREKHKAKVIEVDRARDKARRGNAAFVESARKRGRDYFRDLRHKAIMAYGGYRCVCCGETEPMFLSLDHANNDGAEHRRSLGYSDGNGKGGGSRILKWLRDHGYPEGFQVLCMNCNHGKARNKGICPHQSKLREFGEHPERTIPSQAAIAEGVTTRAKARSPKLGEARRTGDGQDIVCPA